LAEGKEGSKSLLIDPIFAPAAAPKKALTGRSYVLIIQQSIPQLLGVERTAKGNFFSKKSWSSFCAFRHFYIDGINIVNQLLIG
jgi:hypothetical protein